MMRKYCATCYRPIIPGSNQLTTSLMGDDYHISCLNCAKCNLPLWGKPFVKKKDGKLYCEDQCEPIRSKHMSMTNQSQIFYNNEVDPNDKLYMLNQINPPLVMPLISPRFNMMNNLMYQNPYSKPQQQQQSQNNYDNYNDYLNRYLNTMNNNVENFSQNFDLQTELNKAIDKNEIANKIPDKLNQNNGSTSLSLSNHNDIKTDNSNLQNGSNASSNLTSQSASSVTSSISTVSSTEKKCHKCKRSIANNSKDTHSFEDKLYHKDCYKCDKCNNELYRMKKVLQGPNNSGVYCEPCYYNLYGPKCARCGNVIMPYMLSNSYNDKLYHKECFVCQWCKKNLGYEQFIDTGKMFICKNCY